MMQTSPVLPHMQKALEHILQKCKSHNLAEETLKIVVLGPIGGTNLGTMPRVWPSSQVATTTAGGRLGDRHMPG